MSGFLRATSTYLWLRCRASSLHCSSFLLHHPSKIVTCKLQAALEYFLMAVLLRTDLFVPRSGILHVCTVRFACSCKALPYRRCPIVEPERELLNVDVERAAFACSLKTHPKLSLSIAALVSEIWLTATSCFDVMITLFRKIVIAYSSQVRFVA